MKYDRSQCNKEDFRPIAVTIKNDTNKKIYRVKYEVGQFRKNISLSDSHKKESYDNTHYSFYILNPKQSHFDCISIPTNDSSDEFPIVNEVTDEDKKNRKIRKEEYNKNSIFRALYRDIIFSDGEKVSGYSDIEDILLDKHNN